MERKILEVGCGSGRNYFRLSQRGKFFGVDLEPENIRSARTKFPKGRFEVSRAEELAFTSAEFDEVYALDVLEHVDDLSKSLDEIARVSKPGSRLVVEVPNIASEKFLLKLRPTYWDEIGHRRLIDPIVLENEMKSRKYNLVSTGKVKGIENLVLGILFFMRSKIVSQNGLFEGRVAWILTRMAILFSEDFNNYRRFRFLKFLRIITMPLGKFLSRVFPKTEVLVFEKMNEKINLIS